MVESGAVPAGYFANSEASQLGELGSEDSSTAPGTNGLSPEYSSDGVVTESPFTSGNPIDMSSEAPQSFVAPVEDEPQPSPDELLPENNLEGNLEFELKSPLSLDATEDLPEVELPAIDSGVSRINSASDSQVSAVQQPEPSLPVPAETQQFVSAVSASSSLEDQQPEVAGPVNEETKSQSLIAQPLIAQPSISEPLPQLGSIASHFVSKAVQQSEAVVEGELYEEPIAQEPVVQYARSRPVQQNAVPVQGPVTVQAAMVQQPVEHQSIVQDSKLDPVYGLPLNNNVSFGSLPTIEAPTTASPALDQHLHVHIHHEYGNGAGLAQGPTVYRDIQPVSNEQVVYRDDQGRTSMAPAAKIAQPNGDQRTYYNPPKQILRLKAVTPIDHPRAVPSVASIQMRDTIVQSGKHLLTAPEYQTRSVQINHGLPGIDHEKLREAFQAFPMANPLR